MRYLIDVLGAPTTSGGMRLHATQVLQWWAREYPGDDLVVVGPEWVRGVEVSPTTRLIVWPNDNPVFRALGQQVVVPLVFRVFRRQRLIATNSVISWASPARRSTVVAHDWRHLSRPDEFTAVQRLYRHSWRRSAMRAAQVAAVSPKTAGESARLLGRADVEIVENGRDHAAEWSSTEVTRPAWLPGGPHVLTYGQHSNKRPELVVDALHAARGLDGHALVVLGAGGSRGEALRLQADRLSLGGRVHVPGYVPEAEYRWLVSRAAAVVLASSEEGFALPLAEAEYLGVPSVVTIDSGVADQFVGVVVAEPDAASLADAITRAALSPGPPDGRVRANSWSDAVHRLRAISSAPIRSRSSSARRRVHSR